MRFVLLDRKLESEDGFVRFWADQYRDLHEELYAENIVRPLTPEKVIRLYEWKNSGKLSGNKRAGVKRYCRLLPKLEGIENLPVEELLHEHLGRGGAVWRIFFLHIWQPERYPIYDQHVHRAMIAIGDGMLPGMELDDMGDAKKITSYVEKYLSFFGGFRPQADRLVDKALWTFGKFVKRYPGMIGVA